MVTEFEIEDVISKCPVCGAPLRYGDGTESPPIYCNDCQVGADDVQCLVEKLILHAKDAYIAGERRRCAARVQDRLRHWGIASDIAADVVDAMYPDKGGSW